jgi:hypothetical protein
MSRYQHKDISFEPPSAWLDSTVARFHPKPSPLGSPPVPSITMAFEPMPSGLTVGLYAVQLLVKFAKTVPGFEFLNREETMIGDRHAVLLRFQFKPNDEASEPMEQTTALVTAGNEREPEVAVLTIASPAALAESSMALFTSVLRTVRFENPVPVATGSSPARPPAPPPAEFQLGMPGVRSRQ